MVKIGQRWFLKTGYVFPNERIYEITGDIRECYATINASGKPLPKIKSCPLNSLPITANSNEFWQLLRNQDSPENTEC